jgi:hypothetical protein
MNHIAFPSIEQFSHARRNVVYATQYRGKDDAGEPIMDRTAQLPTISYEGTVKVHGTNSGLVLVKNPDKIDFYCQSREQLITPEKDNAGFARFIHELSCEVLDHIVTNFPENWEKVAIYGEYAGKGIQKNVAVADLPKTFYPFAARLVKSTVDEESERWLDIRGWMFPECFKSIYTFPTFKIDINFEQPEYACDQISKWVLEVEEKCPVGDRLGVSGIGEGIVFAPIEDEYKSSRFWFKAKGDRHVTNFALDGITVAPEVSAKIITFLRANNVEKCDFKFEV